MRALRWILFLVVAVVVVAVAVAYVLPREVSVARTTEIAAPPAVVFPLVSDLRQFQSWSPWADIDPNAQVTYSGPSEGVGQVMAWSSNDPMVGSGEMTITKIEPESRVESALDFGAQGTATSWIDVAAAGDGSRVTWGFRTDLGMNPVARWFGLKVDDMVAESYEKGLDTLKGLAETEQAKAVEAAKAAEEAAKAAAEEAAKKAAEEAAKAAEEAAKAAAEAARNATAPAADAASDAMSGAANTMQDAGNAMQNAGEAMQGAGNAMSGPSDAGSGSQMAPMAPMQPSEPTAPANP